MKLAKQDSTKGRGKASRRVLGQTQSTEKQKQARN